MLSLFAPLLAVLAFSAAPESNPVPGSIAPPANWSLAGKVHEPKAKLDFKVVQAPGKDTPKDSPQWSVVSFRGCDNMELKADLRMPPGRGRKPAVIVLGGDRKSIAPLAFLVCRKGYAVLSIDMAGVGPRQEKDTPELKDLKPSHLMRYGTQTIVDLRRCVDMLTSRSDIDRSRIAFVGFSVGGTVGARFFVDDPRVKTAAFVSEVAGLPKFLSEGSFFNIDETKGSDPAVFMEMAKEVSELDPVNFLSRAAGRPILLLHGDKDEYVPTSCFDSFYNAAPNPKKRIVMPGGHIPNPFQMVGSVLEFLDTNLAKP